MWDQTYILSELPAEEETEEEVEFICDVLELHAGATVLDLCCGPGRHGRHLVKKGMAVVGVDSSRFLLREALTKVNGVHLVEGDMRHIPLKPVCDAVINLFTSFGFFDDKDNRDVLKEIATVLKPGGRFLLDYWNPYVVFQLDQTRNWWWASESTLALAEVRYDAESGQLSDYRTVIQFPDGKVNKSVNRVRFYFPTELKAVLEPLGLMVRAVYGDFDYRPFAADARRMITVAEKC